MHAGFRGCASFRASFILGELHQEQHFAADLGRAQVVYAGFVRSIIRDLGVLVADRRPQVAGWYQWAGFISVGAGHHSTKVGGGIWRGIMDFREADERGGVGGMVDEVIGIGVGGRFGLDFN